MLLPSALLSPYAPQLRQVEQCLTVRLHSPEGALPWLVVAKHYLEMPYGAIEDVLRYLYFLRHVKKCKTARILPDRGGTKVQ